MITGQMSSLKRCGCRKVMEGTKNIFEGFDHFEISEQEEIVVVTLSSTSAFN